MTWGPKGGHIRPARGNGKKRKSARELSKDSLFTSSHLHSFLFHLCLS